MKSIYSFLIALLFFACSTDTIDENLDDSGNNPPVTNPSNKPNILLIIADDMGVDATPGYNLESTKPNMPTLTGLQNSGIRYNNVWSNPTCTPTRATMLTGKYGFRTGVTKVDDVLSTSEVSIQSYLKNNGASEYSNAVIGKWHLAKSANHPNNMGIDHYAGLIGGGVQSYWNWNLNINGNSTSTTEYTTTKFTDLAIDWIRSQDNPWFLWLAYNAPHDPFHLPLTELHTQGNLPTDEASINANPLPYYMAMIEAMDTEIGRLLNSMPKEELENTVIIFIGDNGTPGAVIQGSLKTRAKGSIYQGGVNVPMVVSGPDIMRNGATEDALINATDLFSTIVNIAGIAGDKIHDSQSFYQTFSDDKTSMRDFTYAESRKESGNHDITIRNTNYKYMQFDDSSERFYQLNTGELEETNLLNSALNSEAQAAKDELISELAKIKQ